MIFEVRYTAKFKKDLKIAARQGKNFDVLFNVVEKLAQGEKLDVKFRDHALTGNYVGYRECHLEPDWLLVYRYIDQILVLSLSRLGSHSDLFR